MKRKDKNTKKERNESLVLLAKTEKSKCQSAFDRRQKDQTNTQHQTDSQALNQICHEHIWVTFHPKTNREYLHKTNEAYHKNIVTLFLMYKQKGNTS